jgi:hypothetical protein
LDPKAPSSRCASPMQCLVSQGQATASRLSTNLSVAERRYLVSQLLRVVAHLDALLHEWLKLQEGQVVLGRHLSSDVSAAFVLSEDAQQDERGRAAPRRIQRFRRTSPAISQGFNVGLDVTRGESGLERKRSPHFRARQEVVDGRVQLVALLLTALVAACWLEWRHLEK